jgi:uncharacterized protein
MKLKLFIIGAGLIFLAGLYSLAGNISSSLGAVSQTLSLDSQEVSVEIADTQFSRAQGLSGRSVLENGTGLLFVFDSPEMPGFWMKDMNFPIDILWFDEEKKLVDTTEGFLPESFPESVYPSIPVLYVLETNINEFEDLDSLIGKRFILE